MFDVYVHIVKDTEPELVRGVDYTFIKDIREGEFIKYKGIEYKIEKKVFDLDNLDYYLYTEIKITDYQEALLRGNKLIAVKLYREKQGCSLKEAKDYIDALSASFKRNGFIDTP